MNANDNISRMIKAGLKEQRELKNEHDANLALVRERDRKHDNSLNDTLRDMFRPFK